MISVLTINHNNSEMSFLEKFSFNKDNLQEALLSLKNIGGIDECMILSTCNRVELYVSSDKNDISFSLIEFLSKFHSTNIEKSPVIYQYLTASDAVYHLFKVASGIDSMILGEPQIINQIKESYLKANECNTVGPILHRLVQMSLRVAKKVRSETAIGSRSESISNIAMRFSKKIFDNLSEKKALIIGTGEMSQLFIDNLISENINEVYVASRDIKNAINFCDKYSAKPILFEDIRKYLQLADIIFTSTGSNEFILKKGDFDDIKSKDIFIVDIALPRDIDPRVGDLDFCYLYDLDDFKNLSINNKNAYSTSIKEAIAIINSSVESFDSWLETSSLKDLIQSFQKYIESVVNEEIKNSKNMDKDILISKITNKILHIPISKIKGELKFDKNSIRIIQDLFNLEKKKQSKKIIKEINEARNKNWY